MVLIKPAILFIYIIILILMAKWLYSYYKQGYYENTVTKELELERRRLMAILPPLPFLMYLSALLFMFDLIKLHYHIIITSLIIFGMIYLLFKVIYYSKRIVEVLDKEFLKAVQVNDYLTVGRKQYYILAHKECKNQSEKNHLRLQLLLEEAQRKKSVEMI